MAFPATDPDLVAAAFIAIWTPGSVPVGSIGAIVKRTPDAPYRGALPIVEVKPAQNVNTPVAAANSHQDQGWIEVTYRDAPPSADGKTLTQIEDAFWVARNALLQAVRHDPKLSGGSGGPAVSATLQVEEQYRPDGPFAEWQGAEFVVWASRWRYIGPKQNLP